MKDSLPTKSPWLAPLAGFSDLPFRLVCRDMGCSFAFTEMVSATGLIYNTPGTYKLLATNLKDTPLAVQIFGAKPKNILLATKKLLEMGFTYFDLNCGCSVKKVTKTGAGASLLKEPKQIVELVKVMGEVVPFSRLGVKTRLGYELNQDVYLLLAEDLAKLNIGWFTLHPRYARQKFSGQTDWQKLKILKQTIPELTVIGSGDLFTAQDGLRCLEETGIDNIMFARGALRNPYIFTEFKLLKQKKSPGEKNKIIALLLRKFVHYYQTLKPGLSALKMRTILPKMVKELPAAKKIRHKLTQISSWEEIEEIAFLLEQGAYHD